MNWNSGIRFHLPFLVLYISAASLELFGQAHPDPAREAEQRLKENPCDLRALATLTVRSHLEWGNGQNQRDSLKSLSDYSSQGLNCMSKTSSGLNESHFQRNRLLATFNWAAGFVALQNREYDQAQVFLRAAVGADPADLQSVYTLALAYLQATPANNVQGLFYLARAVNLAGRNSPVQKAISEYGVRMYKNYHGSKEGWDTLLTLAKRNNAPPVGFTITRNPWSTSVAIEGEQQ